MIVRSGNAASFLVEFPSGHPDGNISWRVLGEEGAELDSGFLVVPVDAVSAHIVVDGDVNTLIAPVLLGFRDVIWSYTVNGEIVNGEARYSLEARVPFGVSPDGVRSKLGVDNIDVPDSDISLVRAYLAFNAAVNNQAFVPSSADHMILRDAIEALAALYLIPTMPVRTAIKEASGTDSFQRDKVNWGALAQSLQVLVDLGIILVLPGYDPTGGMGTLFILASPSTDAITGEGSLGG